MSRQEIINSQYIVPAVEVLVRFCLDLGWKLDTRIIAAFALAWRDENDFELRPNVLSVHKVRILGRKDPRGWIVRVEDLDDTLEEMTERLNQRIMASMPDQKWFR